MFKIWLEESYRTMTERKRGGIREWLGRSDWKVWETERDIQYEDMRRSSVPLCIFIWVQTDVHPHFHWRQLVSVNNANNFLPRTRTPYNQRRLRTPQGQLGRAKPRIWLSQEGSHQHHSSTDEKHSQDINTKQSTASIHHLISSHEQQP